MDKEQLRKEMDQKALNEFNLTDFATETLDNFAHRYIESKTTGICRSQEIIQGQFAVKGIESNTNEFTHLKDKELLKQITEQALLGIFCQIQDNTMYAMAFINWNSPNFDMKTNKIKMKEKAIKYEDDLDIRNNFARLLEEVCEVFC